MLQIIWKAFEIFAVLFYGGLAIVLLFIFSLHQNADIAAAGVILAAGVTYLFQALNLEIDRHDSRARLLLNVFQLAPVLIFIGSLLLALKGV